MRLQQLAFVAVSASVVGVASADVLRVSQSGSADYSSVRAALQAAEAGDTVSVAPGNYDETSDPWWVTVEADSVTVLGEGAIPSDVAITGIGMGFRGGGQHRMENVRLYGNVYLGSGWPPNAFVLKNCVVSDRVDTVYCSTAQLGGSVTVQDCTFENLSAPYENATHGMALDLEGATQGALVERCVFSHVETIGGVDASTMTVMGGSVVCDCVFVENSGYQGAAIVTAWHTCCGQPEPVIENCTFYRNETLTGGAAVFLRADEAVISHCIFANTINGWGAVILGGSGEVECNDFWMNDLGTYGCGWCLEVGNFEADPMFCDPENGDFHISDNSPCQPRWHDGYPCGRVGALGSCSTSSAEGPAGAPGDDSPLIVVGNPVTGGGGDATVWFTLARSGTVSGSVHACDGRKVVDLGLQSVAPGRVEVPVPMPRDLPSGTYYVKMQTPDGARTARLVLLR